MARGHLLIDISNIGFAGASTPVLKVGDQETQAVYHALRIIRAYAARFPNLRPFALWDGATWRKEAFAGYKATRALAPKTVYDEQNARNRASWQKQKPLLFKALRLLGVPQFQAANLEADDLAGILCRRYATRGDKVLLLSGDKDWIQLVGENVSWIDPVAERKLHITHANLSQKLGYEKVKKTKGTDEETREWRGVPSARAWLEIKALMGDSSDEIPGVGGIGERGAIELLIQFGSVATFMNRANLEGKTLKLPKKLEDFATDMEKGAIYLRNLMLMDLASPHIPAPVRPRLTAEPHDRDGFEELCRSLMFKRMLDDLPGWCEPFRPASSVSTDSKVAA